MNELKISIELANGILGYLGTKPYQEVFQLIGALQKTASDQSQAITPTAPAEKVEAEVVN